jgi:hypothetical protein
MSRALKEALQNTATFVALALKALKFWHRESPVSSVALLARFVETRSKYVAQTTLYGYLKTRAGTRYTSLFDDDVFARSLNIAKWQIYLAGLSDLAIYAAARTGTRAGATAADMAALAGHLVNIALEEEAAAGEHPQGFEDFHKKFAVRVQNTPWTEAAEREAAFRGSLAALVEWAPVADELKMYDTEIVKNSMRFKWKNVRDQLEELLEAEAVMADWRSRPHAGENLGAAHPVHGG